MHLFLFYSESDRSGTGSSEPISEQITRLFPKCRPRTAAPATDVNLNPASNNGHGAGQAAVVGAVNKLDPDEQRRRAAARDAATATQNDGTGQQRDTATDRSELYLTLTLFRIFM